MKKLIATIALATCLALPAAAQVTLELDADEYTVGDIIQITITNTGDEDVEFWGTPAWCVFNIEEGCLTTSVPDITTFAAGEILVIYFDTDENELTPGDCMAHVRWATLAGVEDTAEVPFHLADSVGNEATGWGVLKALYR